MGAGSQYQKASPPHESSAAFVRVESVARRRHSAMPAATWTSCSHASQPSSTGTVIGTTPTSESTVYTAGASTQTTTAIMSRTGTHKGQSTCHEVVAETPCDGSQIQPLWAGWTGPRRSGTGRTGAILTAASWAVTLTGAREARERDDRGRNPDRGWRYRGS